MGIAERKARAKQQRSSAIVDAAERIIASKGIVTTTMDDIAQAAELGKATLYEYYKNKEEILLAIQKRASDKLSERFAHAYEAPMSGYDKLQAIGQSYHQFCVEYPHYYQFIAFFEANTAQTAPDKTLENVHQAIEWVLKAIHLGRADGSIRRDIVPEVLAHLLWAISNGILQMMHLRGDLLDLQYQISATDLQTSFFKILKNGVHLSTSTTL
ncbi:MAG TPA: hypothetical protein DCM08_02870 [Microscillaceae bacterium]|jgi:AcrR family transcriptional regulator|nr:hypothetical protein [Microscillaceae bacterium]